MEKVTTKKQSVWIVSMTVADDGMRDQEIFVFSSYRRAKQFFDSRIKQEIEEGITSSIFKDNLVEKCNGLFFADYEHDKPYALENDSYPPQYPCRHYWNVLKKYEAAKSFLRYTVTRFDVNPF